MTPTPPGATIVVGQHAHDRAEFAQMVEEGRWSELLNVIPIHRGDFFQIDPGTIHAIKEGTTILETQQSSDVTYRVYDYDRVQDDGTKRPLHIQQSLDCVDFNLPLVTSGEVTTPVIGGIRREDLLGHSDVPLRERHRRRGHRGRPQGRQGHALHHPGRIRRRLLRGQDEAHRVPRAHEPGGDEPARRTHFSPHPHNAQAGGPDPTLRVRAAGLCVI